MKKVLFFVVIASILSSCVQELNDEADYGLEALTVTLGPDTRIQLNDDIQTVWNEGDLLSVYNYNDANERWKFTGATGDRSGVIRRNERVDAGAAIDKIVVVYPYNKDYVLSSVDNTISTVFPDTQHYLANSYGLGENIMISSGTSDTFSLKSVFGWLKLELVGTGTVREILLYDNNFEQLNGPIDINYETLDVSFGDYKTNDGDDVGGTLVDDTAVILDCGENGVRLTPSTPTVFYMALVPHVFIDGFTIEVTGTDGSKLEKSTAKEVVITRNAVKPFAQLRFDAAPPDENDFIVFADSKVKELCVANWDINEDGELSYAEAAAVTNIGGFHDEFGFRSSLITSFEEFQFFTGVTEIPYWAFIYSTLSSITIPDSVTSIGADNPFTRCYNLTKFTGKYASDDNRCLIDDHGVLRSFAPSGLTDYLIPDGVCSIGNYAFCGASLESVTLPDSVSGISDVHAFDTGVKAFYGKFASEDHLCLVVDDTILYTAGSDLTEYVIPTGIKTLGYGTFGGWLSLTSITIPETVTDISQSELSGCSKLTDIYCCASIPPACTALPSSVTIYVPAESVEAYKIASGWSDHADNIVGYDFGN